MPRTAPKPWAESLSNTASAAVIHLEEAIVAPAEMLPYLGRGIHDGREGNLAYHNSLMVQFWSALATRDTRLMTHVLGTHFPDRLTNATYATYIRCHDDIGWAIDDADAPALDAAVRAAAEPAAPAIRVERMRAALASPSM